jgi:hypothetical protein
LNLSNPNPRPLKLYLGTTLSISRPLPKQKPPFIATFATHMAASTWVIIGASRGIGFEFVRQLLARGDQVIAAVRDPYRASELWQLAAGRTANVKPGACVIHECDVTNEPSINVSYDGCVKE